MAKSLRSRSERKKRRAKREKFFLPREIEQLNKQAKAAEEREEMEAAEQANDRPEWLRRKRKQLVRHSHVRSMRSGPKPFEIEEIVEKEYVPKVRDYEKILDECAQDSDDHDVVSDGDDDFQTRSRSMDRRSSREKSSLLEEDIVEKAMARYLKKHKNFPKWAGHRDKRRAKRLIRKVGLEDELLSVNRRSLSFYGLGVK